MRPVIRMHACDYDHKLPTVPSGKSWNFYNTETCAREGKGVACASLRPAETFMRACRKPIWKLHVSVNENAQTFVSSLLPVFKGFYDTHMRHTSVSYRHAKRSVHFIYIYANTETRTCMHGLHDDEIHFTSMDAILKRL